MSERDPVLVERLADGVLMIGIDRPAANNRLDPATLIGLGKAFYAFEHDDALRVAVLYGVGPDFSPGIDPVSVAAAIRTGLLPPKDPDYINPFGLRPPLRSKPLVVAVQGITAFGGHELFLAADIRVAASDTRFRQAEVTRGAVSGAGATIRMPREAGWGNAMRALLTGDEWGADEAYRWGLVQAVTPVGQQIDRALGWARKIARAAPLGVRATLASAHQALPDEPAALAAVNAVFQRLLQSEDRAEWARADREGRAPVFHGR
ncbi:MAG TPA: crotonase/enoyl-CoA hydratase family protein [Candidatus Sulfotelmatobacter sp.]|nr:crotonase/enoyl-CoA hydratase family protein [Candidatus Sulfotelmatobacter sp.]